MSSQGSSRRESDLNDHFKEIPVTEKMAQCRTCKTVMTLNDRNSHTCEEAKPKAEDPQWKHVEYSMGYGYYDIDALK